MKTLSRRMAALLGALLALTLTSCSGRTGEGWKLSDASSSRESSSSEEERPDEPDDDEPDSDSSAPLEADPEEVAQTLLDDGLATLAVNYQGNFDDTDEVVPEQMLWSLYKLHSSADDFKPDDADYNGYNQLSQRTTERLVERWFGPDAPALEPRPEALGDPVTGVLVNYDEESRTYYFLEADLAIDEEFAELKLARNDGDAVTIRFNTQNSEGIYQNTYNVKARPDADGNYYLYSFNRGKQKSGDSDAASEEEEADSADDEPPAGEPSDEADAA